jgi:hypothetical protein
MGEPRSFAFGALAVISLAFGLTTTMTATTTSTTAVPDPVAVHAPAAVAGPVGQPVPVPGTSITGFAGAEAVRVVVSTSSGQLSVSAPFAPVSVPYGYPALGQPGPALAFEGTQSDVNAVVSHLRWVAAGTGPADVTVDATPAGAAYDATTGHFFRIVPGDGLTWTEAVDAAAASSYDGEQGYLATVTTPETEALISRMTSADAWIGASAPTGSTTWAWTTGPGGDQPFWTPSCTTDPQSCPAYSNWASAPTDAGPLAALLTMPLLPGADGAWITASPATAEATAYVVEYGGTPGDTAARHGHAAVTLNGVTAPTSAPAAPTALASTSAGTVVVHWTAATATATAPIDHYVVTGAPAGACTTSAPATRCTITGLAAGQSHTFRLAAANVAGAGPSSAASAEVVPAFATSSGLVVSPSGAATAGDPVTLTATVATSPATATVPPGSVTFVDATTALGSVPLSAGRASLTTTDLAVGRHTLKAVYGGSNRFAASASTTASIAVTAPAATTTSTPTIAPTTPAAEATTTGSGGDDGAVNTNGQDSAAAQGETATTAAIGPADGQGQTGTTAATAATAAATSPSLHIVFDVGVGTAVASSRITVRGQALEAGSKVTVTAHSTPMVLATLVVPASGEVEHDVTLPETLADGDHRMIAVGSGADGAVERIVPFAVEDGTLSRIGAVVDVPHVATATTGAAAPSGAPDGGAPASAPATGGSHGPLGLPLPVLLVALPGALLAFVWWRSKRPSTAARTPSTASKPATPGDPRSPLGSRPDRVHAP